MQYELTKLQNNLHTLFINSPGSTAATIQIWFRAGSALEKEDHYGIAHFLEHMFFKGTKTRPGAKIAHEVETFGGEINAFTSFDYTCYYINTPSFKILDSINILLDMVAHPEFDENDLIPERGVVFEEYRRSVDSPNQFAFNKLQQLIFKDQYAHPILGNESTIKNFSREQLVSFRNAYYNLKNCLFIVAGDLNQKDALIKAIENYQLPEGNENSFYEFKLNQKPILDVHQKEVAMCTLSMVIAAPPYLTALGASEDLAINCLGFGETSRLYSSLVLDKTLANNASASTMFMANGGAHFIRLSFPYKNITELLEKFTQTITSAINQEISSDEVIKIKNQYLSSKIYEMESIESFSFSLGHSYAQCGDIKSEEEFIEKIKKTTAASVNKSLKDIFTRNIHLSLQTPNEISLTQSKKELQKFQQSLTALSKSLKAKVPTNLKIKKSNFDQQVQLLQLMPGISLIYRQNTMTPTYVLQAYLRGGLTEETGRTNGVYGLLSNMLTKGYDKINYEKIRLDFEEKSSSISSFAGKNAYGLLMHGLSENLKDLLPHFKGALLKPDLPLKYLKHEKQLSVRALKNQKKDPVKKCFQEVLSLFFNHHPYALNPIGTEKSLSLLSQKDLLSLHRQNLKNKEMIITYCGDAALDDILSSLQPLLSEFTPRKTKKIIFKKMNPLVGLKKFIYFDREQTQIFHGISCKKMDAIEHVYLKMLNAHLSGQSSELFVEVRDKKGLAYSAQPIHFQALEGGYFGIYMASGHDKVDAAIDAILEIINKIKQNGLTLEDFNRIKTMIKGQNLINVQTNEDFASIYSIPVLQGQSLDYYHLKNQEIENLTHQDFQKNIKKILSQKWNTVVVGRNTTKCNHSA